MNNFLEFIMDDIETKKTYLSNLPTKTTTNRKKYNSSLENIESRYEEYAKYVHSYIEAKKNAIKVTDERAEQSDLKRRIKELEHIKALLNPMNSYTEKMEFDGLLYEINNYYIFNFHSLNDIINGFLDKFEQAGIFLTDDDFDYTCYVHEYMSSFLEVRRSKSNSYSKVSEIFEQIYWTNPELIEHIELNFRKLIRENAKKFQTYIVALQKEVMEKNYIKSYAHCLEQLQNAYLEYNSSDREDIYDIIELAKDGEIDVNQYFEDSKVKMQAFNSLIAKTVDMSNPKDASKICESLERLKNNVEEYADYNDFVALFDDIKEKYTKIIKGEKTENKGLTNVLEDINKKEEELGKLNKRLFGKKTTLFELKIDGDSKKLKAESVARAKELYKLYKTYDEEYFKDKIISNLNSSMSIADLLELYYSFDYFKKLAIQKVYNITDYNEISSYSERFDTFALNPRNIVMTGVPIFENADVPKIIANKYRLNNISLNEMDLNPENLNTLLSQISLILRVKKIENSSITIDQLWFIVEAERILKK